MTNEKSTSSIWEEEFVIPRPSGSLPVFCTGPEENAPHPAIILVHEIFGLNEHIRDVARRLARESFVVYAPDLFAYAPNLPSDHNDLSSMRDVWASIPDEQLIGDLQAVFSRARASEKVEPRAIGTLGFCMGGAIAYIFACRTPLLAWVVDFYGRIYYKDITERKLRHPIAYTGGLHCPFLGLFAGLDELITEEHIEHLKKKFKELGKSFQIKVYGNAKHAFFNDQREHYHYDAANDAWMLALAFMAAQADQRTSTT